MCYLLNLFRLSQVYNECSNHVGTCLDKSRSQDAFPLVVIEYKSPNLNTLPRLIILLGGIDKSRVWHTSCAAVLQGVEALNERYLIWTLGIFEVPSMIWI